MGVSIHQNLGLSILLVLLLSGQVHAFGAGNIASISRVEGQNWRHGDIEDALLTLFLARVAGGRKFSKLDVQRVYFGNWLRDYSQAVDVGTLKYVSKEAIRILIWVLGFMSFGYGTKEFEVTTERLGCYEPTEHIDNPLGYADGEDARRYDSRLRGPIDEEQELSIDPRTGLKNYIANENIGIGTSAGLVRRVFQRSIELGRRYARSRNDEDLHEALRLLGTGLHCLEDYAAHSNYTELSLIELGESAVFPHVGRNTKVEIDGVQDQIYPIVTGTFGGVDFFHSVLGEISDKTTQSEVQSLEGVINESQNGTPSQSFIQDLLSKIPEGLIGDRDNQAGKMDEFKTKAEDAKTHNQEVSPREPEEWTQYLDDVHRQVYPILEWHDDVIKSINRAIEKIPVLPELIEQFQEQINVFVFSVLAPYILPIITQVKTELQTGSSEVIQSSQAQQHIVFDDDDSSNPTHSMLSKDHFSNVLNEPAGRIASQIVKWTVPQLMECWDNEDIDIDRTLDRIINGIFHHPALRQYGEDGASDARRIMFSTVEEWWNGKDETEQESLREQLSREGVLEGKNHKEGVHDSGHGCGKPLTLHRGQNKPEHDYNSDTNGFGGVAAEAVGEGALGGLVGGLTSRVRSMLLGESSSSKPDNGGHETHYDGSEPTEESGQYSEHWRRSGGDADEEKSYSEVNRYQREQWQEGDNYTPSYTRREEGEETERWQDRSEEQSNYATREERYADDGDHSSHRHRRRSEDSDASETSSSAGRGEEDGFYQSRIDRPKFDDDDNSRFQEREDTYRFTDGVRGDHTESNYNYDNDRPSYGREQYNSSRFDQNYEPRYGQAEGHGDYERVEYGAGSEYRRDDFNSSNEYAERPQYGRHYGEEPRGYEY